MDRRKLYTTACYPGTFDPITLGHVDIIKRASRLFEKVFVVVANPVHKKSLFSLEERVKMVEESVISFPNVEVKILESRLLMDFCREYDIGIVIRGMRAVSDFEYEFKMAWMNRKLFPEIEVVFLLPSEEYTYLSSTLVKEIATLGGDISSLVPEPVLKYSHLIKERIYKSGLGDEKEQSL
ncbi:MAG: pantetheine-phosphate adenylyltransferase [bacterium]|nr:pantetheine-phosphate adenylyltransferase [bacterium]